jgi:hypothetical protein
MAKECIECKERISGRIDKKFCCDQCRNVYNNKRIGEASSYIRSVNNILRRNRNILEELLPSKNSIASRSRLMQKGFDLSFYTHTSKTRKGEAYFCYEYGYMQLNDEQFYLLRLDTETL